MIRLILILLLLPTLAFGSQGMYPIPLPYAASGSPTFEIRAFDTGSGTNSAECSMSVNSGEKLVVSAAAEQISDSITISSSPSITWTSAVEQDAVAGGGGRARIWTAEASSTGTMTVTTTASASGGASCVLYAITGSESTMGGATARNTGNALSTDPSVSITTTRADSILIVAQGDYNAVGEATVYNVSPPHTERFAHRPAGMYNGWHYTAAATTIGSYTIGMTAPDGQAANIAILEVRKP